MWFRHRLFVCTVLTSVRLVNQLNRNSSDQTLSWPDRSERKRPVWKQWLIDDVMTWNLFSHYWPFTGPLWRESTGHRWIPLTKGISVGVFFVVFLCCFEQTVEVAVVWDWVISVTTLIQVIIWRLFLPRPLLTWSNNDRLWDPQQQWN